MADKSVQQDVEIDAHALKLKYAEEREKRLRSEASSQYRELKGEFAHLDKDPWAKPISREPVVEQVDVLIVGGGMAGLLAGAHLRQRGVTSIRIVDKSGDFGGTWYWNRYPGCACDVESYTYLPLLEETGFVPSERYAKAEEIYGHCKRIAKQYDLDACALSQTAVQKLEWIEEERRWLAFTDRGDRISARFVISCTGLFNKPKLPGIPGMETFSGHSFHTARWDYAYTGGGPDGPLTGLSDKVVGVIGTGATAIQVVPRVAAAAKRLYVFQRTPSSVSVRNNRPTDQDWATRLEAGWHGARLNSFTMVTTGYAAVEDLVDDAWTDLMKALSPPRGGSRTYSSEDIELAGMKKMEQVRQRISGIVKDPATAAALMPYYHYGCKRPTFSDEYLQAFNRPNVTLVDTNGRGVDRITPRGAVVADEAFGLDCIIYATGFDFMTEYARESGIEIFGRGGRSLRDHWARGARTLFGMQTHGFPNFFLVTLVQAGVSWNFNHVAAEQAKHVASVISECLERGIDALEPTQAAEDAWVDEVVANFELRRAVLEACTPSYYNYEGDRPRSSELNISFMGGPIPYFERLAQWREGGDMPGMTVTKAGGR